MLKSEEIVANGDVSLVDGNVHCSWSGAGVTPPSGFGLAIENEEAREFVKWLQIKPEAHPKPFVASNFRAERYNFDVKIISGNSSATCPMKEVDAFAKKLVSTLASILGYGVDPETFERPK